MLLVQGVRVEFDPQVIIVTWWVGTGQQEDWSKPPGLWPDWGGRGRQTWPWISCSDHHQAPAPDQKRSKGDPLKARVGGRGAHRFMLSKSMSVWSYKTETGFKFHNSFRLVSPFKNHILAHVSTAGYRYSGKTALSHIKVKYIFIWTLLFVSPL